MKQTLGGIKLYSLFVSSASMIAVLISGSILFYNLIQHSIISEEEYLLTHYGYNNCEYDYHVKPNGEATKRTPEQIEKCEKENKERAIAQRKVNFKETFVGSATWFIISGIILAVHYRLLKREEEEAKKKA